MNAKTRMMILCLKRWYLYGVYDVCESEECAHEWPPYNTVGLRSARVAQRTSNLGIFDRSVIIYACDTIYRDFGNILGDGKP